MSPFAIRGAADALEAAVRVGRRERGLSDDGTYWLARARFMQAEAILAEYEAIAIAGPMEGLVERLTRKSELLARAANSHADLVAALETILSFNGHYDGCFGGPPYNRICEPVCTQARAALRKARGEQP